MAFLLSFLGLSISLIAWQLWSKSKKAYLLGASSFVFLLISCVSLIATDGFSVGMLSTLAISFISLSALSYFASIVRSYSIFRLPYLAVSVFALYQILQFQVDIPSIAVNEMSTADTGILIDSEAELLVQVKHEEHSVFMAYAQNSDLIEASLAFKPENVEDTELDDFFAVNILGESPKSNGEILALVQKAQIEIESRKEVVGVEINELVEVPTLQKGAKTSNNQGKYLFHDPLSEQQWALEKSKMNDVYRMIKKNKPSHKAKLFILDTGVDGNHEDLQAVFAATKSSNDRDKRGHGTHCAGIAAAMTGNSIGIGSYNAGKAYTVSSIKVLADFGGGTQQGIIKGMIEAVDMGADVISMSLGGRSSDRSQIAYNQAVEYAKSKNVIVVVAAGNSSMNAKLFSPANSKGVITVAAIDQNLEKASFSNTVEDIEMAIAAPGVDILSTFPDQKYQKFSGTSMAAPFVAGLVSLMKSYDKSLTTEDVYDLLSSGSQSTQDAQIKSILNPSASLGLLLDRK